MALSEDRIVEHAVGILDRYGLADLTMRRLAEALDVKAGALYWHFPNKQSLLAGVADRILGDLRTEEPEDPDEALHTWAFELRDVLLSHRDAAELVASSLALGLGSVDPAATVRTLMARRGMTDEDADAAAQAFVHFVLGHVVEEQTKLQLAELGVMPAQDVRHSERQFRRGVEILVAGLRVVPSLS